MPTFTNRGLVASAKRGDTFAYSKLVERFYPLAYTRIWLATDSPAAPRLLARETFLKLWQDLRTLQHDEMFGAWLCRVAEHVARRWNEDSQYAPKLESAGGNDPLGAAAAESNGNSPSPEEALRKAFARLPSEQRDMALLMGVAGCSGEQAAGLLDVQLQAGRRTFAKAQRRLEKYSLETGNLSRFRLPPPAESEQVKAIVTGLQNAPVDASPVPQPRPSRWARRTSRAGFFGVAGPSSRMKSLGTVAAALLIAAVWTAILLYQSPWQEPLRGSSRIGRDRDWADLMKDVPNRTYRGIGMVATLSFGSASGYDYVHIIYVVKGLPADDAGLVPGDRIVRINGRPLSVQLLISPNHQISGPAGTRVNLSVIRPNPDGEEEYLEIDLLRVEVPFRFRPPYAIQNLDPP